jgi:hypothetical protein
MSAVADGGSGIDPRTTAGKIEVFLERRDASEHAASAAAVAAVGSATSASAAL